MARKVAWKEVGPDAGISILSPAYVTSGSENVVFTSGCVGVDAISQELPEDLELQTRNALQNLSNVLKASGSSLDQVVKVLLFVADGSYASVVNRIYQEYFPNSPARSCIVVSFPNPKLKVELECVAAARKKRWFKL
ncbi:LANO_0H21308g1_1 [Lachancea nothofagi CBS 11611]|uniref:LANO_0H21308g1_1 n=1 Tax=Lachancea nothofagi CBS 11611 TaxID=1266666 RepID=A0A1G4KND1_9SACH|nr:LANO_0H21308g1_1 [Lachancea nothofagi CBS 11611]